MRLADYDLFPTEAFIEAGLDHDEIILCDTNFPYLPEEQREHIHELATGTLVERRAVLAAWREAGLPEALVRVR